MLLTITPIYAAILAVMLVVLSIRVIQLRRRLWIALGHENNEHLLRRQRAQQNFTEYAPLALILLLCAELQLAPGWSLHGLGTALVIGRGLHAFGVSRSPENYSFRTYGMILSFAVLALGALLNLWLAFAMRGFAG